MHFVWFPFLNSWFVLQIAEITPQPPSCPPPRAAVEDEAENSPGAPEPHDQLQRCGKETGGAEGSERSRELPPGRGQSSLPAPRPRHRQQHPQSETPRAAQGSAASAVLLVRAKKKKPEPSRVNVSSSQAPVHIGEHRHNLLRTTRPWHRFDLQPQVRWICQKNHERV